VIRVTRRVEYADFDVQVRQPGLVFLGNTPNPNSAQFKKKNYWSRALPELHAAYSGICAYTAMYIPDRGSVDHFHPKKLFPNLAYEWDNYRLANGRINSTKGDSQDVLDPFEIEDEWFHLDLPSCLIKPAPELEKETRTRVKATINTLRLNADDVYVNERLQILLLLAKHFITMQFLQQRYPFLYKEIVRQNAEEALVEIFRLNSRPG